MGFNQIITKITKPFHQFIYDKNDINREHWQTCEITKESFRQRINILEDDKNELKTVLTDCRIRLAEKPFDIEKFSTNRIYKINGTNMKISQWLNDAVERQHVFDWMVTNDKKLNITKPKDVKHIRGQIYKMFGSKDPHVPEKKGKDVWIKPSKLIANGFKGDCDDWATFLHYVFQNLDIELYMGLCPINNKEGFSIGNHATLLHEVDGKYYVVESAVKNRSDYISDSLRKFGRVDVTKNIRYPSRMVYMSNSKENYYQVQLC